MRRRLLRPWAAAARGAARNMAKVPSYGGLGELAAPAAAPPPPLLGIGPESMLNFIAACRGLPYRNGAAMANMMQHAAASSREPAPARCYPR